MKTAAYLALIGAISALPQADQAFLQFVAEYGRSYGTREEFEFRSALFKEAYDLVQEHNANNESYTLGINQFADATPQELKKLTGFKNKAQTKNYVSLETTDLPKEVNWATKGAVTNVKNQGQCGSCWAFSSTGSLEGANFIQSGKLVSFSEQQLVDCSKGGNEGCNGGMMDFAFEYYKTSKAETEQAYPYQGLDMACKYEPKEGILGVESYVDVASNEEALKAAVAQQPVSIAVYVNRKFQLYQSGIFSDSGCHGELNHGVLAVGYGTENGEDYWLVKNSWGMTWGEQGYIRISRKNNLCGVQDSASFPIV